MMRRLYTQSMIDMRSRPDHDVKGNQPQWPKNTQKHPKTICKLDSFSRSQRFVGKHVFSGPGIQGVQWPSAVCVFVGSVTPLISPTFNTSPNFLAETRVNLFLVFSSSSYSSSSSSCQSWIPCKNQVLSG